MISRRDFLKKLGIGAGGAVVAKTFPAPVQPERVIERGIPPLHLYGGIMPTAFMVTGEAMPPKVTGVFTYLPPATREDI